MPSLNWRHHALIQALITRGPLQEKDFHAVFAGVTGRNPDANQELFNEYLLKINKELSSYQFELRGCVDQYNGHVCYGVVNNVADEQSKLGTKYSVPQIAFYKGIIEAIAQDAMAQGSISNFEALNIRLENQFLASLGSQSQNGLQIPAAFRNFTMSQKEKTLDDLVRDKWLCYTEDDNIGLGVRSCLEIRSWFRNLDVPPCEVCNEAVVKGELCKNEGCTVRIHLYCLNKKFSQRRGEILCPNCGTQWQYKAPKAELLEEEEEPNRLIQSQALAGPSENQLSGSKRKRVKNADIAGCSSSQASLPGSDMRRVTRRSARQR